MSTYNSKIKIVKAVPRSKRLRDIGSTVSAATSSREVVAAPSVDMSRYMTKEVFDDLFAKVNLGTAEAPHWAIKAKYNLYSVGWLSFNGPNPGSGSDNPVIGAQNLADLGDVALDGVLPGQVLSWNGNKWVNSTLSTGGLDELQLSQYLTSHNYVQQSDLSSYATESWVLQKLQSVGADDLFEKVNLGTAAAPVWAIKAKYNFYSVGWLSFRGPNIGDGGDAPATIASNLADLKDVNLDTLIPGQVLAWNGNKWVNSTPATSGLDESSIADYLAAHNYATHQWVNSQGFLKQHQSLAGYATEVWVNAQGFLTQHQSLAGYATETWVNSQNYATQDALGSYYNKTQVNTALGGKLDKTIFDDLFDKVNLGTTAAPVWAIKAKYSFYSIGWLSFNGANIGDGTPAALGIGSLSDVLLSTPVAGQVLAWNGTKWVNSTLATSGLDEASLADYLNTHGYATQSWANGAFVNKSGDTMTGHLTMLAKDVYIKNSTDNSQYVCYGFKNTANAIIAQIGYHNTAKRIIINPVGSSEPWVDAVGKYNLIVGNNELKYNTYTLWHSGNDGHNSGLDADLLDGVHNGEVTARLVNYNNGGNVSGAVQFMQKDKGWNAWDAPTQNWYSVIKLNHGNGDTYYSRVLAFDFHSDNIYTHRKHNGTDRGWHTLAFIDSTVANANSLGGKAAAQYVTTDTAQTITGAKSFNGTLTINTQTILARAAISMGSSIGNATYDKYHRIDFGFHSYDRINIYEKAVNFFTNGGTTAHTVITDTGLTAPKLIKSGGTSSQFLKADGSVDGTSYATASALSTGLAGKVSKSGDTMSGNLWFGAPDKGVRFNHAGVNGIWGHASDNAATNQIGSTALSNLVIASHWGVAFTSTCSNQTYTDKVAVGIDTRIGSVAAGSWVKASHFLANTTTLCTNLNADLLDSYHVSQLARLTSANASAGAHNLPVYVNGGVVNAVSSVGEAFLSWGGQSLTGGFSPVDGAMMSHLGANRFAFLKPAGTTFQYSTNGGATWSDYGLSNIQKSGFFDAGVQQALQAGKAANGTATASHQLRITIATSAAGVYTDINKFAINFATQGCSGTTVTIEKALESTPDSWVTVASNVPLSGWTAWNVVNVPAFRTYGNSPGVQYGRIRFTFKCTSVGSGNSPFTVFCIMAYGGFGWTTPSYMAATGHLYKYDGNQNAYFPGCVRLNNDGQYPGTTWNNGAGQLGIALVNNSNQTPLLVAHRYGAASDVTGTNRLFALELLNSGAEMRFAFGGATKFSMTSAGVFFANGGIWTNGYMSFRGQNTSSDARLKDIQGRIDLSLSIIAKAPSIIYKWMDSGKMDMGSIAQYWQKYLPLAVSINPVGRLGMDYSKIALASAISIAQSLITVQDDVAALKADVKRLTTENSQLKTEIQQLKLAA